jgi:hypothetical protein
MMGAMTVATVRVVFSMLGMDALSDMLKGHLSVMVRVAGMLMHHGHILILDNSGCWVSRSAFHLML